MKVLSSHQHQQRKYNHPLIYLLLCFLPYLGPHFEYGIETLSAYGSEYSDIEIEENEDFDYDDIHSIELIIEVDNENSEALGDTQVVRIECDTDEETYSVDFD